jgi:hypothetical protein
MMGHRADLKSGDAVDAIGSRRHDHNWRPGERKAIKQQLGKRARRSARLALRVMYGRDHASIRNLQRSRLVGHPHISTRLVLACRLGHG